MHKFIEEIAYVHTYIKKLQEEAKEDESVTEMQLLQQSNELKKSGSKIFGSS